MLTAKQKLFSNLEYRAIFKNLHGLTEIYETSQPFLPMIAKDWGTRKLPKVIWYGAAPYEWDECRKASLFDFDYELELSENWIMKLPNRFPNSLFWRLQAHFLKRYNCSYDQSVWSNLYKIGGPKSKNRGNPFVSFKKSQYELCMRAFKIECESLTPDLIVPHTGELANNFLYDLTHSWDEWDVYKIKGKDFVAFTVINEVPYIWFSRDTVIMTIDIYPDLFQWCETKIECLSSWS